jgi:protein-arginine kinase activator protein McsA
LTLQQVLETDFNGDFRALIEDILIYAIEVEEYELAAIIRDELQNK